MEKRSTEKVEVKDCTSCPYLEFVSHEHEYLVFVPRWYRCQKKDSIFLNRRELTEAYKTCEIEKEVGVKIPLGSEVIDEILTINILFRTMTDTKINLFREDVRVTRDLMMACKNGEEFRSRIGSLALVFESEDLRELRAFLKCQENWKLIKLIENWLNEQEVTYDPDVIHTWENIVRMRNTTYPYHPESRGLISLLRYFGRGFPPDYPQLWESMLEKLLESLKKFKGILTFLIRSKS